MVGQIQFSSKLANDHWQTEKLTSLQPISLVHDLEMVMLLNSTKSTPSVKQPCLVAEQSRFKTDANKWMLPHSVLGQGQTVGVQLQIEPNTEKQTFQLVASCVHGCMP
jgi:hypothetical protein